MRNRTTAIISRTARNPTGSTDGPTRGVLMDDRKTPSLLCRMIRIRSSLKAALAHISSVEVETGFFWLHSLGRKFTSVEQEPISGRAAPVPCHVVVRAAVAGGVRRVTCPPPPQPPLERYFRHALLPSAELCLPIWPDKTTAQGGAKRNWRERLICPALYSACSSTEI